MRDSFAGPKSQYLCLSIIFLLFSVSTPTQSQKTGTRPRLTTEEDHHRAMKELQHWDRWGKDDVLGAANFITPSIRKQALALVKEGVPISLEHDVSQEKALDNTSIAERAILGISPNGSSDKYSLTSSFHSVNLSHQDSLGCHVMYQGKSYNGVSMEEIKAAGGCLKADITALKDGVTTRAVLFDATLLPGKAGPKGWLELGTPVTWADLEALEKIEHVTVRSGDIILLYTGRWKRRAALGPWKPEEGFAGYYADIAYFLKERDVAFIGSDIGTDVNPTGFPPSVGNPVHRLALWALGVGIFDQLDLERAAQMAKQLRRWEFLFTAAPIRVEKATGSLVNPLAIF